ncbi:MAG TPA: SOS response-associated peptidase [Haliangiales bacterium]|nr:SOS response-associated peptidase [Haliangiales bacterium]
MCGRFTLTSKDFSDVVDKLEVEADPTLSAAYRPRYNLPPTDPHMIVIRDGKRRLVPARWGFGRRTMINARAEIVDTNGLYKEAFAERRCLVPADGFYEWTGASGRRRPIWFHAPPGELLLFAGIYDDKGFCILTVAANADVAPVHDRMPAIIPRDRADDYLLGRNPKSLLVPAPKGALVVTPVSSRANSVANDDEACLGPPDPEQLELI